MDETRRRRFVTFGAILMIFVGLLNVLDGIVALVNPDYVQNDLLVGSLTVWGWFTIIFGCLQVLVGGAVFRGSVVALWPAVVLAAANAVAQLVNVKEFPLWSLTIAAIDLIAVFAFVALGMELGVETVEPDPAREGAPVSRTQA